MGGDRPPELPEGVQALPSVLPLQEGMLIYLLSRGLLIVITATLEEDGSGHCQHRRKGCRTKPVRYVK